MSAEGVAQLLLADAEAALQRQRELAERNWVDEVFGAWLDQNTTVLNQLIRNALAEEGAVYKYQTVAALGYCASAGALDQDGMQLLSGRLLWLAGREPFIDSVPAPFCTDPVALLGIALGAAGIADASIKNKVREWFLRFSRSTYDDERTEPWQRCLLTTAHRKLGGAPVLRMPTESDSADARAVLYSRLSLSEAVVDVDDCEHAILTSVREQPADTLSFVQVCIRLAALHWVRRSAPVVVPGRATVPQVTELLKRVPAAMRRWTWEEKPRTRNAAPRKWHIDNEYHVQNLLYAILSPIFPDLTDEQYLDQVGQKNPRSDLLIPSLKLIIEVKFQREGDSPQKVIDEIASDASLYVVVGSPYAEFLIVPFIWDDMGRVTEHDYLATGLKRIRSIADAVIVSRPGDMKRENIPAGESETVTR